MYSFLHFSFRLFEIGERTYYNVRNALPQLKEVWKKRSFDIPYKNIIAYTRAIDLNTNISCYI